MYSLAIEMYGQWTKIVFVLDGQRCQPFKLASSIVYQTRQLPINLWKTKNSPIVLYSTLKFWPYPSAWLQLSQGGFYAGQLVHSSSFPTNSASRASMYDRGSILRQASFSESKNRCCNVKTLYTRWAITLCTLYMLSNYTPTLYSPQYSIRFTVYTQKWLCV